jgi:DNA-binding LacI/PurR family transcriptional regulator
VEGFASNNKYNVLIGQSYDDVEKEKTIVETMKNSRVDGLIVSVAGNSTSTTHFENLKNYNIPIVFFDRIPDIDNLNSVSCNLYNGTVQSVAYLARKQHTRIALLNGPKFLRASVERRNFFLEALQKNKIKADPALIVETDLSRESTYAAIQKLLEAKSPPTSIVAFNDYVALDAMQYLRSRKIKINKDISFVSFAHLPICSYLDNPPLASVEQFPYEQGYRAMEMLLSLINSKDYPRKNTQIILESELIPWKK